MTRKKSAEIANLLPGSVPRGGTAGDDEPVAGVFAALESPRRPSVTSLRSLNRSPSESSSSSGPPEWLAAAKDHTDRANASAALDAEGKGMLKSLNSDTRVDGGGTYKHKSGGDTIERRLSRSIGSPTSPGVSSPGSRQQQDGGKGRSDTHKGTRSNRRPGTSTSTTNKFLTPFTSTANMSSVVPLQPSFRRQDSNRSRGSSSSGGSSMARSSWSNMSRTSNVEGPMGIASTKQSELQRAPSLDDSDSNDERTGFSKAATRAATKLLGQNFVDGVGRRLSWLSVSPGYGSAAGSVQSLQAITPSFVNRSAERCEGCMEPIREKLRPHCRRVLKTRVFQITMIFALVCALFLKDVWIASDISSDTALDALLTVVLVVFVVEWFMECMSWPSYNPKNLFFWMDLLSAASLLLDITYIGLDLQAGSTDSAVVLRAARVLKLSARAGRFVRVVRLLRFVPGWSQAATQNQDALSTQAISSRLVAVLAARASLLIILVVVVLVPLLEINSYPDDTDRSMEAWVEALDETLAVRPDLFAMHLERLESFYADLDHYPYSVMIFNPDEVANATALSFQSWASSRGSPNREVNRFRVERGNLRCDFNLTATNQIEAVVSIAMMMTIIVALLLFSSFLNGAVGISVVAPLEALLVHVRRICGTIFEAASDIAFAIAERQEDIEERLSHGTLMTESADQKPVFGHEHELLTKVAEKLAIIKEIFVNRSAVDAAMEHLDQNERQMLNAFQGTKTEEKKNALRRTNSFEKLEDEELFEQRLELNKKRLEEAVLDFELLNSWNFNPLELDQERNHAACEYFMGSHNHGLEVDPDVLRRFLSACEEAYLPTCAYHNWFHAVDVMHFVYRYTHICSTHMFLNSQQRYAMLVCALAHDLGHPGLNNNFLIETSHELALRYNDKSPLENMHSATLWDLASQDGLQIFHPVEAHQFRDVRKTCIEMILHTDSSLHFAMIKEIQLFRGVNSEIFDEAHALHQKDPDEYPSMDVVTCLRNPEARLLFMKSVLHTGDLSNSMKPFRICRIWAWQFLEELFLQGDIERELGIPVQALNNREAVNRPLSQVNFIEFLISPLLMVMIKFIPPMEDGVNQTLQNMRTWYRVWVTDTKPFPSESEKKALQDRLTRLELKF
eukprot:CAMPEP_0178403288 /NCGR_PEP_ID=MMETSP0689_2-20121128/17289_1 /TAXON_ID=160604 /ORGANISM="Amphidinium massartii, Strain CS-259" /LENGTH=1132 /DNA_ID=CAMNT_0020024233 /DNA_START=63 /DNA_END=3458 /DNA_ORIENTATION=+